MGVSAQVSNMLVSKNYANYPHWVGNQEKIEDGIRFVYEMNYDKENDQIKSVDENGEYLKLEKPLWHGGTASIGKTSKKIFNKWITDIESPYFGLPYYDPDDKEAAAFAKIFSVGGADGNDELAIYDDGTLVARRVKLVEEV